MQKCSKVRHSALTFFALKSCFSCFWTLKMSEKRVILGVQKRPFWVPLFSPPFQDLFRTSIYGLDVPIPTWYPLLRPLGISPCIITWWDIRDMTKPWKTMKNHVKTWFFRVFPVLPIPGKRVFCKIRKVQSQKCSKVPHSSLTLFH